MYEPLAPAKPEIAASAVRSERGGYIAGFLFVVALIVGGGVGLSYALRTERAEPGADDYLRIVDEFLDTRPRQTFIPRAGGLLQVFGPGSYGGGSCGRLCTLSESCPFSAVAGLCRFDVYDNALAAIYYTARGKFDKAKAILDGFLYYMYVKRQETNDKVTTGPEQGLPSGRYLNLLAASYTNARSIPGQYEGAGVADGAVDTGNNAWVGIAMLRYAAATQDACYATAGCDMLFALNRFASCDDQLGGFRARLAPYPMNYRSTEHNIDMFALASMCRNVSLASHAASFVAQMYDRDEGHAGTYVAGTTNDERCTTNVATVRRGAALRAPARAARARGREATALVSRAPPHRPSARPPARPVCRARKSSCQRTRRPGTSSPASTRGSSARRARSASSRAPPARAACGRPTRT